MSENVYANFASIVANLLINNIGTLATHTASLELWTQTNANLTTDWTTQTPDQKQGDPYADEMWLAYQNVEAEANSSDPKVRAKAKADFATLLQNYLQPDYIYAFSQSFGVDLMQLLNNPAVWDKDAGPSQMNLINQFISLIGSTGQQEEQIGQTESKTEASVVQQDGGAQQAIGDLGTTVNGAGGNIAGLLQQPY